MKFSSNSARLGNATIAQTTIGVIVFYAFCVLLIVAVGGVTFFRLKYSQPSLPQIKAVPAFELTERSGKTVTLSTLKGKVLLVDFIYSECPGPCPMISSRFAKLQEAVLKNPSATMVSVTLNPTEDTVDVLKAYAERFHASPDRWLFLTGDKTKVLDLVVNGFMMTVLEPKEKNETLIHSTKIALVDKKGMIRAYFNAEDETNGPAILNAIRDLSQE